MIISMWDWWSGGIEDAYIINVDSGRGILPEDACRNATYARWVNNLRGRWFKSSIYRLNSVG